ncbi:hypothetical protein TVAG_056030 [Trichomonas vaginalis G3]|uniref:Uncharacterized protein n=1 Tax=Trichomonas vaginalis (strain ATCC PRA-98 / G3) TaxID=412133 RepID=A2EL56_TRIV3|nr:PLAC8 motif-containing protein [Trichomonas vaginalis G3]EAY06609.1 hypothetical protein TVAG_056030 [Trichomonas vaginalis G3]KAI5551651.1 PLAC8 motif-containing protein [Trichomonas vaginalis G3]|eukprot:XP_001318832.1 hypothetical protein [Trichomonas vaginalis G3]
MSNDYNTTLLNCFADSSVCVLGCFCPCILSGKNMARMLNEDYRPVYGLCCPSPFWTRRLLRIRYNFEPDEGHDCLIFTFCLPCGICQDARELNFREQTA